MSFRSNDSYLVIDDKKAEIYSIINKAKKGLDIIDSPPIYFTSGINIDKSIESPLKKWALNVITATHDMYHRDKDLVKSLFLRVLDNLLNFYSPKIKIVLNLIIF